MICPGCGHVDKSIPTPEFTRRGFPRIIGACKKCGTSIQASATTTTSEASQAASVAKGEARERLIADRLAEHLTDIDGGAYSHSALGEAADVDRAMHRNGELSFFFEIKERTCTLNGYRDTQFPYAKILEAKRLQAEHGKPVRFYLLFSDCLAVHVYDGSLTYRVGDKPMAPAYRPEQLNRQRQVPVKLAVEDLIILRVPRGSF